MIFGVFRNERGMPEFPINLVRDAKGMTNTQTKGRLEQNARVLLPPSNRAVDRSTIYMRVASLGRSFVIQCL